MREVFIVSAVRTAMGSFNGALATVSAPKLGAAAIKGALEKGGVKPEWVNEVLMGNVLQAGLGQAPARQAAIFAGLPNTVACTTVNKVCASGMKAVSFGAQSILNGDNDTVVAGGMENMSSVPHYLLNSRAGYRMGDIKVKDGMILDGLTDVYHQYHMGVAAELCARECGISRKDQDDFAIESYKRSAAAWKEGRFKEEIVGVEVPQKRGEKIIFSEDEEYKNVSLEKIPSLKPVFQQDGTVTAANASTINDGASALVLMSGEKVKEYGLKPMARIVSYADAAQAPEWFTTAPSKALPKALQKAGLVKEKIDYWELNEAFAVVGLANIREMGLDPDRVDVNGGAVSLGHPLGSSGSRILVTLINVLRQRKGRLGAAGICNGGGEASAMIIELV